MKRCCMSDRNGTAVRLIRAVNPFRRVYSRVLLVRAKPRSLPGHPRIALRLSRLARAYSYSESEFFATDQAPAEIEFRRRAGFARLVGFFRERSPRTLALTDELESGLSDLAFVNGRRVPFPYQ